MSLAAYVSENGLVVHQWRGPLAVQTFIFPSTGECQGQEVGVGGWGSRWVGEWVEEQGGHFWDGIGNVNEINT